MRRVGRVILYVLALIGALFLGAILALAVLAARLEGAPVDLPDRIVLWMDLNTGLVEGPRPRLFGRLARPRENVLEDVIEALASAQRDPRVEGFVVRLGRSGIAVAQAQELRAAVAAMRAAGKRTVAFADSFGSIGNGTIDYYLAAQFDEIWMQPSGELGLIGLAIEMPFFRGALDALGIEPRLEQRHEYKSAVEVLTRKGFSDAARESLQRLVDSWLDQIVGGIAEDRGLSIDDVRRAVETAPLLAREARAVRLIDRLGYWDELVARIEKDTGASARWVRLGEYFAAVGRPDREGPKVALVYGVGPIVPGRGNEVPFSPAREFGADRVAEAISDAVEDDSVKAILLRIDSPGGAYAASDTVWRAIRRARDAGKPVIASMGAIAASGGYFVAMAADRIVASPGTITGSIGVYGGKLVTRAFWRRLGVEWDRVQAGSRAGMWSPVDDYPPGASARVARMLDAVYADFTRKLAKARGLSETQIDAVARGRVWSGADAKAHGLVDEVGGFSTALKIVKKVLGLASDAPVELFVLPRPQTPLEQLLAALGEGGVGAAISSLLLASAGAVAKGWDPDLDAARDLVEALRPSAGVLRMPPIRVVE